MPNLGFLRHLEPTDNLLTTGTVRSTNCTLAPQGASSVFSVWAQWWRAIALSLSLPLTLVPCCCVIVSCAGTVSLDQLLQSALSSIRLLTPLRPSSSSSSSVVSTPRTCTSVCVEPSTSQHTHATMPSLKTCLILLSVLLGSCLATVQAINYRDILHEEWNAFKQLYKKEYETGEEIFRFKVFMENKHRIAKHNQKASMGHKSYTMELNHYGDLLNHEFVRIMNGYKHQMKAASKNGSLFMTPAHVTLPAQVDWRQHNMVTPVKNQGHCGSCWSFSATGALEGQHSRKAGTLVSLSEQNLVDCSKKYGNNGCHGGQMDFAFQYIQQNHGLDTEASYPYEGKEGECRFSKSNLGATDTGFVDIPQGNEAKLQEALATVGPVSIAIDASQPSFQFYRQGVYDEPECSSTELDHGVLAVGYGTDEKGQDYWLVKNSWSEKWGEGGYIRMSRNKKNQCGVATSASYPLV